MADPPTYRQRPTSSSPSETQSSPLSAPSPQSPSRATVPPSEPRSTSRGSFGQLDLSADRPARLQMIVALLLLLVLVAIPLYLWRRPRAESSVATSSTGASVEPNALGAPTSATVADPAKPLLGDPKSILCQDPGPKRTAPEQCDRLVDLEKAFAKAIEDSASCVPKEVGGGTVQYVADVSFKRRSLGVSTPKDGRSLKNAKVVAACQAAVKSRLQAFSLDTLQHAHARYKIAVTATYPGPVKQVSGTDPSPR